MPAWATVTVTLSASAIAAGSALLGAWLQGRAADRRRREEARDQRLREAATIIGAFLELLIEANPDRLTANVGRENPFRDYAEVERRWNDVRPSLLSFSLAHPSAEFPDRGEELT